jgi:hypothetical protein
MRHRTISLIAIACLLAAATLLAQVDPLRERGFAPEKAYQIGDIDSINTFNGNLILSIPLGGSYPINGGLTFGIGLSYNGNIWDLTAVTYDGGQTWVTRADPCRSCNAGTGFMISLGRLLAPDDPENRTPGSWTYIAPDAAEHAFYTTLHDGEPTYSGTWYARDGSYVRLQDTANGKDVQFPDGSIRSFLYQSGKWRVSKISDQYSNYVNVTYPDSNTWQITDMHGRTHYVRFTNGVVTSVELAKFGGGTAAYTIGYGSALIHRSCEDTDPGTSDMLTVTRPTSIALPDSSTWLGFTYFDVQSCGADWPLGLSGRLKGITLPTGGKLEWAYRDYGFSNLVWNPKKVPPGFDSTPYYAGGVASRTRKVADNADSTDENAPKTWTYEDHTHYLEVLTPVHKITADTRVLKEVDVLGLDLTVGGFPGSRDPEAGERGPGTGDDAATEGDQGEGRAARAGQAAWQRLPGVPGDGLQQGQLLPLQGAV